MRAVWLFAALLVLSGFSCRFDRADGHSIVYEGGVLKKSDPETGVITDNATINDLGNDKKFRYPLRFDSNIIAKIPRDDAMAFLHQALRRSDSSFSRCHYTPRGIPGRSTVFPEFSFRATTIVPAYGIIRGRLNYVIFVQPSIPLHSGDRCIAYRRIGSALGEEAIAHEMRGVVEALLSLGAKIG